MYMYVLNGTMSNYSLLSLLVPTYFLHLPSPEYVNMIKRLCRKLLHMHVLRNAYILILILILHSPYYGGDTTPWLELRSCTCGLSVTGGLDGGDGGVAKFLLLWSGWWRRLALFLRVGIFGALVVSSFAPPFLGGLSGLLLRDFVSGSFGIKGNGRELCVG